MAQAIFFFVVYLCKRLPEILEQKQRVVAEGLLCRALRANTRPFASPLKTQVGCPGSAKASIADKARAPLARRDAGCGELFEQLAPIRRVLTFTGQSLFGETRGVQARSILQRFDFETGVVTECWGVKGASGAFGFEARVFFISRAGFFRQREIFRQRTKLHMGDERFETRRACRGSRWRR